MTKTYANSPTLSANLQFRSEYNKTLRWSALGALTATCIMVWVSPRYTPQPYQLRTSTLYIQQVEVIYNIEEPPPVELAPVMNRPIEAAPDSDPDAIDPINLPEFRFHDPAPARYAPADNNFVASSTKPILISQPKPYYPEVARMAQVEGLVIVKVLVDVDGSIKAAEIVKGAHILLNNAALKAARKCVFKPGKQRSMNVPTWVAVPYNFK